MAQLIRVDGSEETIDSVGGLSLEKAQELIGGYVQALPSTDGRLILCDEEGRIKGKEVNHRASAFYGRDIVVGDVVMVIRSEFK